MLTMLPDFCCSICFTASCDTYRKPCKRFVETRVLKSSVVYSVKGFRNKNARIVDQHVDSAKSRYGSFHNLCGRARVADVPINECNIRGH